MPNLEGGSQPNNPEKGFDGLFIRGRLQVATARDALTRTGRNPNAEKFLSTILATHDQVSDRANQNDLAVSLQGGETARMKADIIRSLNEIVDDKKTPDDERVVFHTLHRIMTEETSQN